MNGPTNFEMPDIVRLWILRMLVPLGAQKHFLSTHGFTNDRLASILGLDSNVGSNNERFDRGIVIQALSNKLNEAEASMGSACAPDVLRENIARLARHVGLSTTDCRILEFAVLLRTESLLDEVADWLGDLHASKVISVLARLLSMAPTELNNALGQHGALTKAGLLSLPRQGVCCLRRKLLLLSEEFSDRISSEGVDFLDLIRGVVEPCELSQLGQGDYEHIASVLSILQAYLRQCVDTKRTGVNILIYGAPGTGKSQLVRVMAKDVACALFEVTSEDAQGEQMSGQERQRAFSAAQCFLTRSDSLVVFDEIEDLFSSGAEDFGQARVERVPKASLNRILEGNRVPAFWLANSIGGLDKAFIRRFDLVFELPVPPRKHRERIVRKACADLVDGRCVETVAEAEKLAPAVVTRTAAVVRSIRGQLNEQTAGAALELLISNTLEAQRHYPLKPDDPTRLPEVYDPAFICADASLNEIANGLRKSRMGRICLYGPPGTGKTAYGRWLAEFLEMSLNVKRASDLMSPFVGQTEINIAKAFRKADRAGELLMIDEVDSFLQDRRSARYGWEIAQVNELLTQLESFGGVFVASTNLMAGLDQAALRRFDLKVKFDYLEPAQAHLLFTRHCERLALPLPDDGHRALFSRLRNLTPGDFAAATRQHRFRPFQSSFNFVAALEAESVLKGSSSSSIGFLH